MSDKTPHDQEAADAAAAYAAARRQDTIDALLTERRGYEVAGKSDRVKAVDAALKAAGYSTPAGRGKSKAETA